jgi:hypothetical protein
MSASGPSLSWATTPGATYRVAYKNNLADPEWTYLPNTVTATGSVTSWSDTAKAPQRFYLIVQTQ